MTTTIRQPKVNVNIVNANVAVENTEQKILFIGQKTGAGTATALELNKSIPNDGSEDALFGRKSMLATMIRANKIRNQQVRVDAVALDDVITTSLTDVVSITESGGLATLTTTGSHDLSDGDLITVIGAEVTEYNVANISIDVLTALTFTYPVAGSPEDETNAAGVTVITGTHAQGSITVTGTATENGTLTVIAGSERNHKFDIAVIDLDTEALIGAAIAAAVNADLDSPLIATSVPASPINDVVTLIESDDILATLTTSSPHNLTTGDIVTISGATTGGFNLASVVINVTGTTVFTYAVTGDLGAEGSPEDVEVAIIISSVSIVRLSATNNGTYGESIPIEVRGAVAGITTTVTGMSGGGADPVLTTVFDAIGGDRYQAIVWPYPNDTTEVRALLDPRFNADGQVQDGVAFTALQDTIANLKILGDALNSQSLVIFGDQQETETNYSGPAIVEIPMVVASYFAGFRGLRLDTDGFSIADFTITNNGALDSFGGPALASKPYFNIPFANLVPMQLGRGFDGPEIEDLKDSGITVVGNNVVNNTVIVGEVVTTYKTDFAGNPDVTFTFLNFVDTASQAREFFFNNLRARFAQSRLTTGDVVLGRDMANELVIRSFLKRLYQDLSGPDFVLLEAGEAALAFFDTNLIIDIDKSEGKVTIQMTVPIVTQLREIAATLTIAFDIQA